MLRRFFLLGPPGLLIPRLFPERRGDKDKDDGPRRPSPEDKPDMSDAPEFTPHGSLEAVPDVVDVLLRDNTDLLIDNTVTETTLFTFPVPAYMLDGDRGLRVRIDGNMLNDSGGSVNFTFRLKLGATTMYDKTMSLTDTGPAPGPFLLDFEVMAKNSDAIQEAFLQLNCGGFSAATAGEGNLLSGSGIRGVGYGEATEDGTTALDLVFSVQMNTAHADTWVQHRRSIVEHL